MTVYVTLLALSGFAFGMITNSIGGDVAGNPSGFENIVQILGVETRYTFYLPTWLNLAIIAGGIALMVMTFIGKVPRHEDSCRAWKQRWVSGKAHLRAVCQRVVLAA